MDIKSKEMKRIIYTLAVITNAVIIYFSEDDRGFLILSYILLSLCLIEICRNKKK